MTDYIRRCSARQDVDAPWIFDPAGQWNDVVVARSIRDNEWISERLRDQETLPDPVSTAAVQDIDVVTNPWWRAGSIDAYPMIP